MRGRILYCDYHDEFRYEAEILRSGYEVQRVSPEHLRQVAIGEHIAYLMTFQNEATALRALKICDKLKRAELKTPIFLISFGQTPKAVLEHQQSRTAADAYVLNPESASFVLDAFEAVLARPATMVIPKTEVLDPDSDLKTLGLERKIQELEAALEDQTNFYRPKLQALLSGQKVNSEAEKLKVELSELEAKLMDREVKILDLERTIEKLRKNQPKS